MVDHLSLRDEDRLPWLETVDPDEEEGSTVLRFVAYVVLVLVVVAGIAFAAVNIWHRAAGGNGELIAADPHPYKVKPVEPGGLKVEGEGDAAVATSDGKAAGTGAIDLSAIPEAPVTATATPAASASPTPGVAAGRSASAAIPAPAGKLVAATPMSERPAPAGPTPGGSLVQLGAYPSESLTNAAWDRFTKRFSYLAPLGKVVQPVAKDGKTLYRLRVNAGSANQAAQLCGRLKVAGESCFVAS